MPLDPMVYAKMLGERIADGRTRVYLVNTGWIGGGYGVGHRIELCLHARPGGPRPRRYHRGQRGLARR